MELFLKVVFTLVHICFHLPYLRANENNCTFTNTAGHCERLKGNFLSSIGIKEIHSLQIIECDVSELTKLSFDSFRDLQSISIFNCSSTFSDHENLFVNLNELNAVSIEQCKVTENVSNMFPTNNDIVNLSLKKNKISMIRKQLLVNFHRIEIIDLSYNEIVYIEFGAFDRLMSLKMLNLTYNLINIIFYPTHFYLAHSKCYVCKTNEDEVACSNQDIVTCNASRSIDQLWWQFTFANVHLEGNPICEDLATKINLIDVQRYQEPTTTKFNRVTCTVYEHESCVKHSRRILFFIEACRYVRWNNRVNNVNHINHVNQLSASVICSFLAIGIAILAVLIYWVCTRKQHTTYSKESVHDSHLSLSMRINVVWNRLIGRFCHPASNTLMHEAARQGSSNMLDLLLERRGSDVNEPNESRDTPLHVAAKEGYFQIVEKLLSNGAEANAQNISLQTPLHVATREGRVFSVRKLLEVGAKVNMTCLHKDTPLHVAVREGHVDLVKLLLEYHAQVDARNEDDYTPLHIAAWNGNKPIVELLLERGASVDVVTNMKDTPLHNAARKGHVDSAKLLLKQRNIQLNAVNAKGNTPLHRSVIGGHKEFVRLLLCHKVDMSIVNKEGFTPLDIAQMENHTEVTSLLMMSKGKSCRESRTSISIENETRQDNSTELTPLHTNQNH